MSKKNKRDLELFIADIFIAIEKVYTPYQDRFISSRYA